MELKKEKNYAFEFYRFVFTIIIIVLHFRGYGNIKNDVFGGGYLAVEFFFVLGGYLIAKQLDSRKLSDSPEKDTFNYICRRYKRLFPEYLLALVLLIVYHLSKYSLYETLTKIIKAFPEFLGIQIFYRPSTFDGQLWFVSAIVWGGFLVYYIGRKNKDFLYYVFGPATMLVMVGVLYKTIGHVDIASKEYLFPLTYFKAVSELSYGAFTYKISEIIKEKKMLNSIFATILEGICLATVMLIMWFTRRSELDFLVLIVMGILVLVVSMKNSFISKVFDNKVSGYLGKISYSMYLNQKLIISIIGDVLPKHNFYLMLVLTLTIIFVMSVVINMLYELLFEMK